MTTLRLVELESQQYAWQVKQGLLPNWGYCSRKEFYVWRIERYIVQYCICQTLEEAEEALVKIKEDYERQYPKEPRIVKVIRKVKV